MRADAFLMDGSLDLRVVDVAEGAGDGVAERRAGERRTRVRRRRERKGVKDVVDLVCDIVAVVVVGMCLG